MNSVIIEVIAVAAVLCIIVFIHELGHFLAAKFFGVRVEVFSLGFGPRLMGMRRGETDYRVSALPLGGYVRMAGENPVAGASGDPREFVSKPRWQRLLIVFAGPLMNIALAVGLMVPIYMRRFPHDAYLDLPAVVAAVQPNSPAAKAGLQPGDRILQIGSQVHPKWQQIYIQAALSVDRSLGLRVERGDAERQLTMVPRAVGASGQLSLGLVPRQPIVVDSVLPGSPAAAAGLRPGDRILSVNKVKLLAPAQLVENIQRSGGHPVQLQVARGGRRLTLAATPRQMRLSGARQPSWMLGTTLDTGLSYIHLSFSQAVNQAVIANRQGAGLILDLLKRLLSGRSSPTALQGPIGIVSITGQAARAPTIYPLVQVTSLISLNLGILNLLPVPVLDGGLILFLLIESLMRRDLSLRVKERVYQAGFAFLVLLMTFVVYNDIARAVSSHLH